MVNGQESYSAQEEEIRIAGNPQTWVARGELRVVIPRQSLTQSNWDEWLFRWDFGPKTVNELADLPEKNEFKYGEKLIVKSNGIYSILALEPVATETNETIRKDGKIFRPTVLNVNVTKIDNIAPSYNFEGSGDNKKLSIVDDETGLKLVSFKTLKHYNNNVKRQ